MSSESKVFIRGNKVLVEETTIPATIEVDLSTGKIINITKEIIDDLHGTVIDAGDDIVMSGLVDSHVHVNEPGRTDWEGFWTATRAAAAGGITTLIDMPLNSIPSTTSVENLEKKLIAAKGKCHIDVGFWGGVVPNNQDDLEPLVEKGVVGFKCFLIHSGIDDFPAVGESDVDLALSKLRGTESVLAFHAEVEVSQMNWDENNDPAKYDTFLQSRPEKMECDAIKLITRLCRKHRDVRCHIVHLSAASALPIIAQLKEDNLPLTVETCPHYLTLNARDIAEKQTEYKCCPPIRDENNREELWNGLRTGLIDMIVSDHSPCTADLKEPGEKNFMEAWGGISSVQFGLPLIWTNASQRGFELKDLNKWMSVNPAKLAGLQKQKGQIRVGYDADFVIWDPNAEINIDESIIQHRNKLTPYKGKTVKGKVLKTILRGREIYSDGEFTGPQGRFLLPNIESS